MLQITIVEGNTTTGDLVLEVNGAPNNGSSHAKRNEDVHWKVKPKSNVGDIFDIKMKSGPGAPPSTNIFAGNPPARQGNKHWKGKVSAGVAIGAVYNYDIRWIPTTGGGVKVYDPKISIRPAIGMAMKLIKAVVTAVVALCAIFAISKMLSKKNKLKP